MKERKNIENLFQEKFDNFEILPPENIWEEIKIKLEEKEDRKRIVPFWWKFAGIAAVLVMGLFLINSYVNSSTENNDVVVAPKIEKSSNQNRTIIPNSTNNSVATSNENNVSNEASKSILNNTVKSVIKPKIEVANSGITKPNIAVKTPAENSIVISNESKNWFKTVRDTEVKNKHLDATDNAVKEKKENIFYNYNEKQVIVAQKQEINTSTSHEKPSDFVKEKSSFNSKADFSSDKKFVSEFKEEKNTSENSILNKSAITTYNKNDDFIFTNASDKFQLKNNVASSNIANDVASKNIENNTKEEIKKIDSTSIAIVEPNALEELLKEKEKKIVKEPKINRWQVTSNVAPIYFSSTGKSGSALDSKFENNSKSYNTDYSYGLGVNYKLAKKVKVRTGVNSLSFNYNTNDVLFYQTTAASKIKNLNTNQKGALIQIESKNESGVNTPTLTEAGQQLNKFNSSLNQKLGYIEVPLEMSYVVLDKKFSIEVVGGLSTLFLNQNDVYLESSGVKLDIGEATNLNDIHFSGNIGLGIKYGFLKNLEAKIEPVFKYQMNTYTTNTGNFKPYFIGVYTGLSYNF